VKRALPYFAFLIFLGCGYLGYFGAVRIAYRHKQSTWFSSLEKQDAERLRQNSQTLLALGLSNLLIQNTPSALQNNLRSLAQIRSTARQELWPIIDLRFAEDYAMMARLEQRADNLEAAAAHQEAAKDLLRSLGWPDISDKAVADLADGQLRTRLKQ